MRRVAIVVMLATFTAVATGGCAAVGLTVMATGLGLAAGTGTAYTLDGIAYRTFNASVDEMRTASLRALKRMDIPVQADDSTENGRRLEALAGDRTIHIDLEKLTSRTTRMRVTAKHGWFWRDRSTAGEIIAQTEDALESRTTASQKAR